MSLINCGDYRKWCDGSYTKGKPIPEGKIIHCNMEDIDLLFWDITNTDREIIVVSSDSDYSLCYQAENPVNADIRKIPLYLDYDSMAKASEYAYVKLVTADYQECNIHDKFSVKIDKYTINTFNEIPPNIIKWFAVNANVTEERVEYIPFGCNIDTEENGIESFYKADKDKTVLVYSNFRQNSFQRYYLDFSLSNLQQHYNNINNIDSLTHIRENIPVKYYYEQLSRHVYNLCPVGNGLDSFRFIEGLAVGTIPVVPKNRLMQNASKYFPLVSIEYIERFDGGVMKELRDIVASGQICYDLDKLKLMLSKEFWKEKIDGSRELIKTN